MRTVPGIAYMYNYPRLLGDEGAKSQLLFIGCVSLRPGWQKCDVLQHIEIPSFFFLKFLLSFS